MSNDHNVQIDSAVAGTKIESTAPDAKVPKDQPHNHWMLIAGLTAGILSAIFAGLAWHQAHISNVSQLRSELRQVLSELEQLNAVKLDISNVNNVVANRRLLLLGSADLIVSEIGEELDGSFLGVLANGHFSAGNYEQAIAYFESAVKQTENILNKSAAYRSMALIYGSVDGWKNLDIAYRYSCSAITAIADYNDPAADNLRQLISQQWQQIIHDNEGEHLPTHTLDSPTCVDI